jgi:OPT family oligopeptide transporter
MAPDRGHVRSASDPELAVTSTHDPLQPPSLKPTQYEDNEGQHFTFRGVFVGLLIGILICFSNMYFGLQTGWISGMAMPSALLGFSYFKVVSRTLSYPFSPVENVLVQSVAGSVGTMPLGCGFVGVIPALNFLLTNEENGPLDISLTKLIVWALGIAFFGVVFAVPLRKQVIIREKLKFPSGTAAAALINLLHGRKTKIDEDERVKSLVSASGEELEVRDSSSGEGAVQAEESAGLLRRVSTARSRATLEETRPEEWKSRVQLLVWAFAFSSIYTLVSYFIPLNDFPLFGSYLANEWLWTVNFSPAYVGQGIIMGPTTTTSMLLGAVVGYGILSPLAKYKGWAPGPTDDWATGSKGWIVWVSLGIMLADSLINLGWLVLGPLLKYLVPRVRQAIRDRDWKEIFDRYADLRGQYGLVGISRQGSMILDQDDDARPEHLISMKVTIIGLVLSSIACVAAVHFSFANLIPLWLTLIALVFAMLLSVMGVRALGETDINPVSGISKLAQLFFAVITPTGNKNAVIINLIAGALSESGALQAGDLMQDLKTGHLVGAAPNAQFYGQLIGSAVGAIVSALVYKLYLRVYTIPSDLFE